MREHHQEIRLDDRMRGRLRQGALAGVLLSAVIAGGAPAVAAADFDLAGTTTIKGGATAAEPVRLTRPATIEVPASNSVDVEGGGTLAGFMLVQEGSDPNRPFVFGGEQESSFGSNAFVHSSEPIGPGNRITIPAGDYRMYLLTDGAPAAVTVRLGGLDGAISFAPTRPVRSTLRRPEPRFLPQVASTAGDRAALAGPGVVLSLLTTRYDAALVDNTMHCYYLGEESAAAPTAHTPGCPTAQLRLSTQFLNANPSPVGLQSSGTVMGLDAGVVGVGYSRTTAGLVDDASYHALWLDFDQSPRDDGQVVPAGPIAPTAPPAEPQRPGGEPNRPAPESEPQPAPQSEPQPGSGAPAPAGESGEGKPSASNRVRRPRVSVRATSRRSVLRSGLRVTVTGATGRVRLRARSGRRTVAVGSAVARKGRARVVLRPTRAGRRLLRSAGRTIKVRVTGAGTGRTVRLR